MREVTRILFAEDRETDFELARREIRKVIPQCEFQRVETREAFLEALAAFRPHLVISDYRMPVFDGPTALDLTLRHAPGTPVLILTGTIGDDAMLQCKNAGAADYLSKEQLKGLGPIVVRVLEQAGHPPAAT